MTKPMISADELADAAIEQRTALLTRGLDPALVDHLLVAWYSAKCLNYAGLSLIKEAVKHAQPQSRGASQSRGAWAAALTARMRDVPK